MWRCPRCVAYFSDGGPRNYDDVDLRSYYEANGASIRARYQRVLAFCETLTRKGRFIDVGAGMGYSLEVATQRGWVASGIEPNAALVSSARSRGLDMRMGYLQDDGQPVHDLVLADNVLEHVPEPRRFLTDATRLLAPHGVLVLAVPPFDWLRRALGHFAYVREHVRHPQVNVLDEVDEHVNVLGRVAMARLFERVGLRRLQLRYHHSSALDNPLARLFRLDDGYHFACRG